MLQPLSLCSKCEQSAAAVDPLRNTRSTSASLGIAELKALIWVVLAQYFGRQSSQPIDTVSFRRTKIASFTAALPWLRH